MRILLNTFGSLGDVHPYLAIAIGLRERGHEPLIACSELYREKVQAEGIEFAAVRPDVEELLGKPELLEKLWHPSRGSEYLLRDYIIPRIEESYDDLRFACRGADLVLTHMAAYAGQIAAEVLGIPWISVALQPIVFFSAYDPPLIPADAWFRHLYRFGPRAFRVLMAAAELRTSRWAEPIQRLRKRVGLPRSPANPMIRGQFSPLGTLALFSRYFAPPQPDWPPNVRLTGFTFYDRQGRVPGAIDDADNGREALARFLEKSPAPILFTLGSSAVMQPGTFFHESIAAIKMLGARAVMLTGPPDRELVGDSLPDSIYITSYLPFSEVMPKSLAIVHQGGIGTTAQALRAGRPMLVVPWAHDQPDNADRLRKIGVGRTIPRARYRAARVARELSALLDNSEYESRAQEMGTQIATENGVTAACDALEQLMRTTRSAKPN